MGTREPSQSGLCQCGCGQRTPLAANTIPSRDQVRGQPLRYLRGHAPRARYRTFDERYRRGRPDECWEWLGTVGRDGKGRYGHAAELAHRIAYERGVGRLAVGDQVTQACGNFLCVNPRHLALRDLAPPDPPNPTGLCMCGCGERAPLATQTDIRLGHVRGEPVRYVRGHVGRTKRRRIGDADYAVEDRGYETLCWIWKGSYFRSGYPRLASRSRATALAHRVSYEQENGPVADDLQVDHLCQQIACIRPSHLDAVTRSEHARRGHQRRRAAQIASLNPEAVALARASTLSDRVVAKILGVSPSAVRDLRG